MVLYDGNVMKDNLMGLCKKNQKKHLTWIIHKSRLLQMRGTGCEAVVLHREYPVTKQMQ